MASLRVKLLIVLVVIAFFSGIQIGTMQQFGVVQKYTSQTAPASTIYNTSSIEVTPAEDATSPMDSDNTFEGEVVQKEEKEEVFPSYDLCIVIPTAKRTSDPHYLLDLSKNLEDQISSHQLQKEVHIVVMNGNASDTSHTDPFHLWPRIELVDSPDYPQMKQPLRLTHGDSLTRVKWRSKEALDFATSVNYCAKYSETVLFMQDDVILTSNFLKKFWDLLDLVFSEHTKEEVGLISLYDTKKPGTLQNGGKYALQCCLQGVVFFVDPYLKEMTDYIIEHFNDSPVDWLVRDFLKLKKLDGFVSIPSLVQHQGLFSTLSIKKTSHQSQTFVP